MGVVIHADCFKTDRTVSIVMRWEGSFCKRPVTIRCRSDGTCMEDENGCGLALSILCFVCLSLSSMVWEGVEAAMNG